MLTTLRRDVPRWRRIRAESLPPHVIEAAAEARSAGDWRRAAELADVEVDVDIDAVRERFGGDATEVLTDDLQHLCLDLLWWHLPRHRGGMTTLHPRVSAVLAPAAGAETAPLLRVRLPKSPVGPQRLLLDVRTMEELENERWYLAPRYTWDVRETRQLRAAWGGSAERMPLLTPDGRPLPDSALGVGDDPAARTERVYRLLAAGELVAAWEEYGIDVLGVEPEALGHGGVGPGCPVGVAEDVRRAAEAFGVTEVNTLYGARLDITAGSLAASAADLSEYLEIPVRVVTDGVPADLVLIAAGHQRPDDLHPLMRAALFPSAPASAFRPQRPPAPPQARVRCRGEWHRLTVSDGTLNLADHTAAEVLRESTLRALGGTSTGCFAVQLAWTSGEGRLPRALSATVREVRHRLQHGDTDWLLDGLAAGILDPQMRDPNGWSLLHMAMWTDFARVVPVLLEAGVPVDARDRVGRTPLYLATMNGGHPDFMRLLLAAGADPRAETVHGAYPSYIAKHRSDWQDLSFLSNA